MTDRELMQQALDALVRMHSYGDVFRYQNWQANPYEQVSDSVTALRERLAQPEQEPVAWIGRLEGGIEYSPYHKAALKLPEGVRFDLYTSPQQHKPLTEEEIYLATNHIDRNERGWAIKFARAVIAEATGKKT